MAADELILVAGIAKPHGIRGELRMVSHADSPLVFQDIQRLHLTLPGKRPRPFEIEGLRPHGRFLLVKLAGLDNPEDAGLWRGAEVLVEAGDLPDPDPDEVFLHEIEGCRVVLEDGTPVGVLEGFLDTPEQETWSIRAPGGQEVLFPANEETVAEVDLDDRLITISPPPGLLEIYLAPEKEKPRDESHKHTPRGKTS